MPNILRFDCFGVDLSSGQLHKRGARIRLREKSFQVLAALLEHPGQVVTREELQRRLWREEVFVDFDNNLNTAIARLREALGDSADHPRFIETLPKHGYRFIAPVETVPTTPDPEGQIGCSGDHAASRASSLPSQAQNPPQGARAMAAPHHRGRRVLITALGIVAIIGLLLRFNVGGWRDQLAGHTSRPRIQTLAVLPFDSLSADPEQGYFAESMTEVLITEIGKLGWLRVVSRSSVMQYSGKHRPLEEVARQLHVDAVMEGSIARSGDKVRVTANLFEVSTHRQLLAVTYYRDLGDVLAVQQEVARDITEKIGTKLRLPRPAPGHRPLESP
jgi:TolB-like protein/DNA-binding winged helix-turn-helix (wHTH) protein